ncbi:MAG: hypothetical protein ACI9Y1_002236 [Lentisphaeria bacterium]|jgi:hypothetical protein
MKVLIKFSMVLGVFVLGAGCQWVKPTEKALHVSLVKPAHVSTCTRLGSTTSNVKDSVGIINRREKLVAEELMALAKNEAAEMGGDTIVAVNAINEGRQTFDVYSCQ